MRKHKAGPPENRKRAGKSSRNVQTTLRLPKQLFEHAKILVASGRTASVNELVVRALAAYVRALERKAIDDAFLPMRKDAQYLREAARITRQFAASDAEAIELSERDAIEA